MSLILSCSPRRGGNCDTAAELLRSPGEAPPLFLRDYSLLPCTSCDFCRSQPRRCPLSAKDDSEKLFQAIFNTRKLVIVAPIYFYHLPAQLKALIDRSQAFWREETSGDTPGKKTGPGEAGTGKTEGEGAAAPREAHAVLIGARPTGDKLFEGSILSLRYWMKALGFSLKNTLLLYGLDGPGELAAKPEKREAVLAFAAGTNRKG